MASFDQKYSLEPNHIFEGKYKIIRELGSGGFGMVYLAHQISMDRPVALKILKPGVGAHAPSARERFLQEVKIISKLRHPNTVTIHDYGETVHGVVYMVLEYVEGRTLKELLKQEGAQDPMRSLAIARQVVRSLGEAHNHQIVHRDLKPANVMLTTLDADTDFVKVLDFGVARLLDNPDVDLTSAGVPEGERALIGTPRYMSPEQVRGEHLTGASDLYGMGLILYEMLIGEPAVQGDTTMGLISQQLSPEPLRLRSLQALPECIQHLIRRSTAKNIGQRFRSADEMARAIDQTAMELAEGLGHRGRAATGAYYAASGRFPVVNKSTDGPSLDPFGDATAAGTPSSIRQHSTDSGQIAFATPPNNWSRDSSEGIDYYEKNFDPNDLAKRSQSQVPVNSGSRQHSQQAAAGMNASFEIVGNQIEVDEASGLFGLSSADLPLPPDAAGSPFEPNPSMEPEIDRSSKKASPISTTPHASDESMLGFGFVVLKNCFLAIVAFFFSYLCFIVTGAFVGEFAQGSIQFGVAAILAISIPLFTALGENSQKERFEVVHKLSHRLTRVFIGTIIFAAASAFIMAFAMPGMVADHLRDDPNWMFRVTHGVTYEPTYVTELNREASDVVADMVEVTFVFLGRYDGTPTSAQANSRFLEETMPTEATRPTSTRPGTSPSNDSPDDTQAPSENDQPGANPTPTRRSSPPPTRPSTREREESNEDSDYVRW